MPAFQAPPGTFDVLPPASSLYEALVARFGSIVERAGYGLVVSPMFEDIGVFQRVGEETDVVRKEMYDFRDKGGRHIALRPEGTASIVRAFVEHRPTTPWKTWYVAPNFRYEHSQKGRYRQHHQLGVEVLGSADPDLDVEVIALLDRFYRDLGLQRFTLRVTSLGNEFCRPIYRELLIEFLASARDSLCDEHRDRYTENPLRVLDCKKPECVAATAGAPTQLDHLCEPCEWHFARVRDGLASLEIPYVVDPRLVRGLDYYMRTTFEFTGDALTGAQNGIGGGGRYDGLVEELGGPATPGIGFGTGIERVLLACEAEDVGPAPAGAVDVFVVDTAGGAAALLLTEELRRADIRADRAFDGRSFKAQFKAADRSGATLALVIGEDERARGVVAVKPLRDDGPQIEIPTDEVIDHVRKLLGS